MKYNIRPGVTLVSIAVLILFSSERIGITKNVPFESDPNFKLKFSLAISDSKNINFSGKVNQIASRGNSLDFLYLSYNIDARNTMFKATQDISYLRQNYAIISNILNAGKVDGTNQFRWLAHSQLPKYKSVNNTQVLLYEGYLFRYICDYEYLIEKNIKKPGIAQLRIPVSYLESVFLKWYNKSMTQFNDDSKQQHMRTHIGSHWATVAMFLYKLTTDSSNKKIYSSFFTRYDKALKNNFKTYDTDQIQCYSWNSTYDEPFTNQQKAAAIEKQASSHIQDVAHGNHIIQYILHAHELGLNDWSTHDIQLLANTLKFKIWNEDSFTFADYINGSSALSKESQNTGWKQSDGWMKLMFYDKSLFAIYSSFYEKNSTFLDKTYFNLQFYANFARFKELHP